MEIINKSDERYKLLNEIWSKYNRTDIIKQFPEKNSTSYYIIPELVIKEVITNKVRIYKAPRGPRSNFISNRFFEKVLMKSTGLTKQEYFDLVILKINSTEDRPKCEYCGVSLEWKGRFSHGYYGDNVWYLHAHNYCGNRCKTKAMFEYEEDYPSFTAAKEQNAKNLLDYRVQVKSIMRRYLGMGSPDDKCVFYMAVLSDGKGKLGVSQNVEFRAYNWNNPYKFYEVVFSGSRVECAYLEASVKLYLMSGKEEFDISRYEEVKSKALEFSIKYQIHLPQRLVKRRRTQVNPKCVTP